MEKQFRHKTPYGVVSETYDVDEKVIRDFTFYSNGKHDFNILSHAITQTHVFQTRNTILISVKTLQTSQSLT